MTENVLCMIIGMAECIIRLATVFKFIMKSKLTIPYLYNLLSYCNLSVLIMIFLEENLKWHLETFAYELLILSYEWF